jgi:ribonuclease H2 subunit C
VLPSVERDTISSDALKGVGDTEIPGMLNGKHETRLVLEDPQASSKTAAIACKTHRRRDEATTRFISSFRGRTIQGLELLVEVPPGYVGQVAERPTKQGITRHEG